MDNKNVGVNQDIALKKELSFGYSHVKVQVIDTCEWHVNLLDINYEI